MRNAFFRIGVAAALGCLMLRSASGGEPTKPTVDSTSSDGGATLVVTSPAFPASGRLPAEFTCDGAGISPPVAWSGAPAGTRSFALSLWHTASDREKSYWVVYDIPAEVTQLTKDNQGVGRLDLNDKRRAAYEPMCPKGTKLNTYHMTVFALSAAPKLPPNGVTRAVLLEAIRDMTLAEGTLNFQHRRTTED